MTLTANRTTTVEAIDPRTDPRWDALARGDGASLFTSPPWLRAVAGTYGFDVRGRLLVENESVRAGVVCAEVDDLRGRRLVSFPFSDRCDPLVDDADQWSILSGALLDPELPATVRCLSTAAPATDPRFARTGEAAWHGTALEGSEEDLFAGLSGQARQNVRRARRDGVTVRLGTGLEDVRAFHRLHRTLRKHKYRLLAPPMRFFERIWEEFAPNDGITVALASHEGDVVAGALYLVWDGVLHYKFGASLPDRLRARPNELVAWTSLVHGLERGCRRYDWGLSDLDQPGLVAFKAKFATEERRIVSLQHRPDGGEGPIGADALALVGQLVELLTGDDVPDDVTFRAGEIAYRTFC